MTDVLVACDMIVGSGLPVLKTVRPGRTAAILNTDVAPTGEFQTNKNLQLDEHRMRASIIDAISDGQGAPTASGGPALFELPAGKLATALTGDSIGTNILMLGYAAQQGLLPLSLASIREAIRLNGTFVEGNLRTFALGRLAGRPRKRAFGGWILTLFRVLAALKGLRGTAFDPFGYTAERRMERRLIEDYRALVSGIADRLDHANLPAAIELAKAAAEISGYGPVKDASVSTYESRLRSLLQAFEAAAQPTSRAA
jgi:Pyruvate/2-oxoacid:ferredoxin oxidoreductase gamma subunit